MAEPGRGQIAIIAALPREVAGLVKGTAPDPGLRDRGVFLYRLPGVVVVAAGMGSARAAHAVGAALASGEVRLLVSAGLAGSCSPDLKPGEVVEAATVVDANTGERFTTGCLGDRVLVTAEAIASTREKARLHATYRAAMVDMEAATVARLALGHGMAFRAIKGISDAHDFELESLARFEGRHGSFRTGAFALHTALRPHTWRKAMELGSGSQRALAALDSALRTCIENATT